MRPPSAKSAANEDTETSENSACNGLTEHINTEIEVTSCSSSSNDDSSNKDVDAILLSTEACCQMDSEDVWSQSSDSKGNSSSVNEITSLAENLIVESDQFEKISNETVDIALSPEVAIFVEDQEETKKSDNYTDNN